MSLSEFFYMGGYAFYVWTSYGIALVVLVANLVNAKACERRMRRTLDRRMRLQRRRSQ